MANKKVDEISDPYKAEAKNAISQAAHEIIHNELLKKDVTEEEFREWLSGLSRNLVEVFFYVPVRSILAIGAFLLTLVTPMLSSASAVASCALSWFLGVDAPEACSEEDLPTVLLSLALVVCFWLSICYFYGKRAAEIKNGHVCVCREWKIANCLAASVCLSIPVALCCFSPLDYWLVSGVLLIVGVAGLFHVLSLCENRKARCWIAFSVILAVVFAIVEACTVTTSGSECCIYILILIGTIPGFYNGLWAVFLAYPLWLRVGRKETGETGNEAGPATGNQCNKRTYSFWLQEWVRRKVIAVGIVAALSFMLLSCLFFLYYDAQYIITR